MNDAGLPSGLGGGSGYGGGPSGYGAKGDKGLTLPLAETFRLAWLDEDLRARITFVMLMFAVFALGIHVPVPVPGLSSSAVQDSLKGGIFDYLNLMNGGALRRLSVFAMGINPYITASIIIQILQTALPQWKKEMQEGGQYARAQGNKRTRYLTLLLCFVQGYGLLKLISQAPQIAALGIPQQAVIVLFWTAGSMAVLWLGEQISEKGIGNGVSLMIFAGIVLSLPGQASGLLRGVQAGAFSWFSVVAVLALFLVATYFIVYFTTAQRRIPIQHMRRQVGTKVMGGATSYLPLSVNMAGVLPIIFASSLVYLPNQFALMFGGKSTGIGNALENFSTFLNPSSTQPLFGDFPISRGVIGMVFFTVLIFFFTYFWTAIQYNVEDIANNLKRGGSFIPGVRPGKQTKEFLDGVISRVTVMGAAFISVVALLQYIGPALAGLTADNGTYVNLIGGTSLLIMVSVALETMRQIEANLLMKQYGNQ